MKVDLTQSAVSDLESIALYIALDNPKRAETFVDELVSAAYALTDRPLAYPIVPRFEAFGIRRKPYGNYLIFYVVRTDSVVIQRVLNSAQDYEAILFPED